MADKTPIRVIRSAQHGMGVKPVRGGVLQGGPPQSRLQQTLGSVSAESIQAEPYKAEDERPDALTNVEAVMAGETVINDPNVVVRDNRLVSDLSGNLTASPEMTKALAFYRKHIERRKAQRKKKRKAEREELKRLRELVKEKP